MFEDFVFGPRIESIKHNAFLPCSNEVVDLSNDLANYPVIAFFFTDLFTKDLFVFWRDFDTAFFHFAEVHAAKVGFRNAMVCEVINSDGFAATSHTNDGKKFNIVVFHGYYYNTIKVRSVYD